MELVLQDLARLARHLHLKFLPCDLFLLPKMYNFLFFFLNSFFFFSYFLNVFFPFHFIPLRRFEKL
jgi:hypothetical protein